MLVYEFKQTEAIQALMRVCMRAIFLPLSSWRTLHQCSQSFFPVLFGMLEGLSNESLSLYVR